MFQEAMQALLQGDVDNGRAALRAYIDATIGFEKLGVALGRPQKSLMVNLRARDYGGDTHKLHAAMHYLTWFLPKTYSILPLPDDWSDAEMTPL